MCQHDRYIPYFSVLLEEQVLGSVEPTSVQDQLHVKEGLGLLRAWRMDT